jgi:hypothetical protein
MSKSTSLALTPQDVGEAQSMAETLSQSSLVPEAFRKKPSDTYMAITYGMELGMPPVTSLMSIAVIKGKPTLYAHAMVALVLNSEKAEYFHCVESDAKHAIYETKRKGSPTARRYEFNETMAKAAGLLGGNYSKYGQQMYEARAKAYLAKDVYPDVLHGMMSAEEAQEVEEYSAGADTSGFEAPEQVVAEYEEAEATTNTGVHILDLIGMSETKENLEALRPRVRAMAGDERKEAVAAFRAKDKELS